VKPVPEDGSGPLLAMLQLSDASDCEAEDGCELVEDEARAQVGVILWPHAVGGDNAPGNGGDGSRGCAHRYSLAPGRREDADDGSAHFVSFRRDLPRR
jgi:hypothetical protein